MTILRDNPEILARARTEVKAKTGAVGTVSDEEVLSRIRSDESVRISITEYLVRAGYIDADDPELLAPGSSSRARVDSTLKNSGHSKNGDEFGDTNDVGSEQDSTRGPAARFGQLPGSSSDSRNFDGDVDVADDRRERSTRTSDEANAENESRRDESAVNVRRRVAPYSGIPSLRDLYSQTLDPSSKLMRFGASAFLESSRLKTTSDVPAGTDYVLGVGDGLSVDLWGSVSRRLQVVVDREGRISLPEVGNVVLAGKTLSEARQIVQKLLSTQYNNLQSDVSLTRIRNVRVYVVGDVERPGAYDVSALSTVVHALYAAGGPSRKGSLRHVKHFRGATLVADIDVYSLLLQGLRGELAALQPGDTILVPPIGPEVAVSGMVRRPAVYELREESDLKSLLDLAGGVLVSASLRDLRIERVQAHESRRMIDVKLPLEAEPNALAEALKSYKVFDGDHVLVGSIPTYSDQSVYLDGHVIAPGKYSYRADMKVTDLVRSFKLLLPEPADRAEIIRLEPPDYRPRIIEFDLRKVLSGEAAPSLQPFDTVRIFGRYQYDAPKVYIYGDVLRPGEYPMSDSLSAAELVRLAGGFTRSALRDEADLASYSIENGQKVDIDHRVIAIDKALAGVPDTDVRLKPGDVLTIHQLSGWSEIGGSVRLSGEIAHAGTYSIAERERLSSVLRRAGGFRDSAYPRGAILVRANVRDIESKARNEMIRRIQSMNVTVKPGPGTEAATLTAAFVQQQQEMVRKLREQPVVGRQIIQIAADISQWQGSSADIEMRAGDELIIPKTPDFVLIQGQVNNSAAMTYRKGKSADWYLRQAGGATQFANRKGMFIVRANGSVVGREGASHWWGGDILHTMLLPGDTLVVPEKIVSENATWRGVMNSAQVMSSLAIAARVATTF